MDLISGRPFWPAQRLMPRYPPLRQNVSCDIAIVGGGFTGALAADTLSRAGRDVIVVDRRDIGWGSTAASTALIEYQLDAELHEFVNMAGTRAAVRAYRLSHDAVARLEAVVRRLDDHCDWQRRTGLHLASGPSAIKPILREIRARKKHGFRVEFLSASELARTYEVEAPGALLYEEAAQVDPYHLTHALIRNARSRGLRVFGRTEVRTFECGPRSVVLKTRRGVQITAGKVVFATGYESLPYLQRGLARLVSTYALVSRARKHWPRGLRECVFTETMDPYLYVRTTANDRVMMGGEDEPFTTGAARARRLPAKTQALLRKFERWFPDAQPAVSRSWAGAFAVTSDGLGYIDETPMYPHAIFVIGTGGNGMVFSTVAAGILDDLIRGRPNRDAHLFRFNRPWNRHRIR